MVGSLPATLALVSPELDEEPHVQASERGNELSMISILLTVITLNSVDFPRWVPSRQVLGVPVVQDTVPVLA